MPSGLENLLFWHTWHTGGPIRLPGDPWGAQTSRSRAQGTPSPLGSPLGAKEGALRVLLCLLYLVVFIIIIIDCFFSLSLTEFT